MGIQTSSINNGPVAGFKNKIINGGFDIWQRGTTSTTSVTAYGGDRWRSNYAGGTGSIVMSQESFGPTSVTSSPYFSRQVITGTVGQSATVYTDQRIENVEQFSSKQCTVSFLVKASANLSIQMRENYYYGSGGSSQDYSSFTTIAVTTSWNRVSYTFTAPDLSAKTIGANSYFALMFYWSTTQAGGFLNDATIDVADVQLEFGPVATDFEQRPIGIELALCQRYFAVWQYPGRDTPIIGQNNADGAVQLTPFELPVTMRSYPSSMTYAGAVISGNLRFGTGSGTLVTSATLNNTAIDTSIQTNRATIIFGSRSGWIEAASVRSNHNSEANRPKFYFSAEL